MARTVTIVLPDGYADDEEFAKDCGFELADDLAKAALIEALTSVRSEIDLRKAPKLMAKIEAALGDVGTVGSGS
jgi:hypothetical protein